MMVVVLVDEDVCVPQPEEHEINERMNERITKPPHRRHQAIMGECGSQHRGDQA